MRRLERAALLAVLGLLLGSCMFKLLPPAHPVPAFGCSDGTMQLPDACFVGGVPDPLCGGMPASAPRPLP